MTKRLINRLAMMFAVAAIHGASTQTSDAQLHYERNGNQLVLSWTNMGMILQSAPTVSAQFTNIDGATSPYGSLIAGSQLYFRLRATSGPPPGMVIVPEGTFTMGNHFSTEGDGDELPLRSVQVSAFYLDQYEVSKALWDEVHQWATNNGYSFDFVDSGQGKAANHPVHSLSWYDAVKWCNARSEKENLSPAYYTDPQLTTPFRVGQTPPSVNWASGYRLPTEAEWEKAARGGVAGRRFPWGDTDTITHNRANYFSLTNYPYDISSTREYHPAFATGSDPYTGPVGSFPPNGYGLHDMAGNVSEWCWDYYAIYPNQPQTDPRGPDEGAFRVPRGGSWVTHAYFCRLTYRGSLSPTLRYFDIGFRCALPAPP